MRSWISHPRNVAGIQGAQDVPEKVVGVGSENVLGAGRFSSSYREDGTIPQRWFRPSSQWHLLPPNNLYSATMVILSLDSSLEVQGAAQRSPLAVLFCTAKTVTISRIGRDWIDSSRASGCLSGPWVCPKAAPVGQQANHKRDVGLL